MSDPHDTDPRRFDQPRRLELEAPSSTGLRWTWLAALAAVVVILGLVIGYNQTEQASNNQSNAPTTTGAAPSAPPPAPPATGGNASPPAAPAPNEAPH